MDRMARVFLWSGCLVALAGAVGLCVFSVVVGLNRSNELAGVVSAAAALAGVGVSVYGLVLTRRSGPQSTGPFGEQSVTGSTVLGGIVQAQGVTGGVSAGAVSRPVVAQSAAVMPVLDDRPAVDPSRLCRQPLRAESSR